MPEKKSNHGFSDDGIADFELSAAAAGPACFGCSAVL
jgi:hypothetical protein